MYVNVDIPPVMLAELMDRAKIHGLRRPQVIRYALQRFISADYPISDVQFVCPACAGGEHCGGQAREITFDIKSRMGSERMLRWVCVCGECRPPEGESDNHGTPKL